MLGGLVAGVACGVFAPGCRGLGFLSAMFGHAIKMVVMPLIFLSVTVGSFVRADCAARLGKVALSSIVFFVLMTGLAASLGAAAQLRISAGSRCEPHALRIDAAALASSIDWTKFLVDLIPANIVALCRREFSPGARFRRHFRCGIGGCPERAEPAIAVFEHCCRACSR